MLTFRVTDIETIVDESVWTRPDPSYKLVPGSGGSVALEQADQFPPAHAWRVVSVAYADVCFDISRDPRYWLEDCYTCCSWGAAGADADESERLLLRDFSGAAGKGENLHFVTWNGRTFDLPVIVLRCFKHAIPVPWYYTNRDVRYRYTPEGHLDLMDFFSDYGASRQAKLGDVARLIGLPGKTDMTGASVADMYAEAVLHPERDAEIRERVGRYCLQDALQTAVIFLRSRHLLGKVTPETHDAAISTFAESRLARWALDMVDWERLKLTKGART